MVFDATCKSAARRTGSPERRAASPGPAFKTRARGSAIVEDSPELFNVERTTKTATMNLRLAADERQLIERAARRAHLQLGTWMRQTCLRAAEREAGGDDRRARLLEFIRRARAGDVASAANHAADVERARGDEWKR